MREKKRVKNEKTGEYVLRKRSKEKVSKEGRWTGIHSPDTTPGAQRRAD